MQTVPTGPPTALWRDRIKAELSIAFLAIGALWMTGTALDNDPELECRGATEGIDQCLEDNQRTGVLWARLGPVVLRLTNPRGGAAHQNDSDDRKRAYRAPPGF
ncbi:MAG: hypothetical protein ACT4OX_04195 [Actinomycetota bacterium]